MKGFQNMRTEKEIRQRLRTWEAYEKEISGMVKVLNVKNEHTDLKWVLRIVRKEISSIKWVLKSE